MKTVRRGTKLFDKAIDSAKKIMAYDAVNAFIGKECTAKENGWNLRKELELCRRPMLRTSDGSSFTLDANSNLWFSWKI